MSESLKEIQDRFAAGILDPKSKHILSALKAAPEAKADRFSIYRGNLLSIWNKTLANIFPVVERLVGGDFFEDLARVYGRKHPSTSGDLNSFGEHFSEFLSQHESLQEYPYIGPVAELEWRLHCSYYAQDKERLSLPQFIAEAGERVQESSLIFAPDVSFHTSQFATSAIWQAHQSSEVAQLGVPVDTKNFCVVSRPQWRPEVFELSEASYRALVLLSEAKSLDLALDLALQIQDDFDVGGQLQTWFSAGLFVGHYCKE